MLGVTCKFDLEEPDRQDEFQDDAELRDSDADTVRISNSVTIVDHIILQGIEA